MNIAATHRRELGAGPAVVAARLPGAPEYSVRMIPGVQYACHTQEDPYPIVMLNDTILSIGGVPYDPTLAQTPEPVTVALLGGTLAAAGWVAKQRRVALSSLHADAPTV